MRVVTQQTLSFCLLIICSFSSASSEVSEADASVTTEVENNVELIQSPENETNLENESDEEGDQLDVEEDSLEDSYNTEKKLCHTDLTGPNGLFASNGFPESYSENTNCTWNITVKQGHSIQLTFHLLNIEPHLSCHWDWIKVFDSNGTVLKHVCGHLLKDLVIVSSNNTMSIHFYADNAIQSLGFLASWETVPISLEESISNEVNHEGGGPGYILKFPQSFTLEGPEETVCLQLMNVSQSGSSDIMLFSSENVLKNEPTVIKTVSYDGNKTLLFTQCFKLQLPADFTSSFAVLGINGTYGDYKILSFKGVRVIKDSSLVLVQTDKYEYRPGQEVRLRVMFMDSQLRPLKHFKRTGQISVVDPSDKKLRIWQKYETPFGEHFGVYQLSVSLPEEAILGTWKIFVKQSGDETMAKFVVNEALNPKLEVQINGPKTILRDSPMEVFDVCGVYTHGGKVNGSISVTFFTVSTPRYWRAKPVRVEVKKAISRSVRGCAKFTLNNTELQQLSASSSKLTLSAKLNEAVTNNKYENTWEATFESSAFKFDFQHSSMQHIVSSRRYGLPYIFHVNAKHHDGVTPLAGVRLEVRARLFTSLNKLKSDIRSYYHLLSSYDEDQFLALRDKLNGLLYFEKWNTYMTDANGSVKVAVMLDNVPENVTKLSFKVTALDFPSNKTTRMKQPVDEFSVDLTHSSAISVLTIYDDNEDTKLQCNWQSGEGTTNLIHVFFTAQLESSVSLSWTITSGGSIIGQGDADVNVGGFDKTSEMIGDAQVLHLSNSDKNASQSDHSDKIVLAKYSIKVKLPLDDEENQAKISNYVKLVVNVHNKHEGSILSALKEYPTESCVESPTVSWSLEKGNPGSRVNLSIGGDAESLCGYSVVDKSVDLVKNPNTISPDKLAKLKDALADQRVISDQVVNECKNATLFFEMYKQLGLFVLSDQLLENADCNSLFEVSIDDVDRHKEPPIALAFSAQQQFIEPSRGPEAQFDLQDGGLPPQSVFASSPQPLGTKVEKPKVSIRNYFPETWLFDLVQLDNNGTAKLELESPHTITTWVADTFCMHPSTGLRAAVNKEELIISQDFFIDMNSPFAVKRGELFPLNVSVFNTVKGRRLPMIIELQESDAYKAETTSHSFCLQEDNNIIKSFRMKMKELNSVNITVSAMIISSENCDPAGDAEGYKDVIKKSVFVKPEGFPVEITDSEFICRNSVDERTVVTLDSIVLPGEGELVDGSLRAYFRVTGDVIAPALANLEKLVQLPTGCGEQNLMSMVPNIYLIKYLESKGVNKPDLVSKAKEYMRIGYERQQNYRFNDGSYSVWGPKTDKEGSLWLTAFVGRAFVKAHHIIHIDLKNLQHSIQWILSNQNTNDGCFQNRGYVIHNDFKGSDNSLTATVLVTLLEVLKSDIVSEDSEFHFKVLNGAQRALSCLESPQSGGDSPHAKSIITYAKVNFREWTMESCERDDDLITNLMQSANTSLPGKLFWTAGNNNNKARDVEISAYNILSLTVCNRLPEAQEGIRWLATQLNSLGGLKSTQDTMIAIQAISEYSINVNTEETDLEVSATVGIWQWTTQIVNDNRFLFQEKKIDDNVFLPLKNTNLSIGVEVTADGVGCFMAQTVLRYNVHESPDRPDFSLIATQIGENFKVCANYTGSRRETDMVVIEIELLSGFIPYKNSLKALLLEPTDDNEITTLRVKKFEYDDKEGKIVLYFDEMLRELQCREIEMKQVALVEELKPATVKIYDYYNSNEYFSTSYDLQVSQEEPQVTSRLLEIS